ncbi:SUMF1/EgtB/PvdO family nonheme iron enzyme [Anabaena sp. FACHB-1237]|uniref:bifunctional serine/threonine-protein kinase/formylglycine-generating enzyme family protein n=1 Tax=Anabaena sp. FACHB-1237 TaxID=2692769 RepID=UPI001680C3B3|nr:bifunctional serine/threonine-protein kinase/formylglycine-generating enzyme family protein [Anabaena sp. FACHB-1237]MBD2136955.1 SUMF1/EgtB/PvdO family nonheme iron enzyme [Anabaena sp. FACHB-1237]
MLWQPNQPIEDGKYIILNQLGDPGGFGITYSAKDTRTGQIVAIKTLNQKRQAANDFKQQQIKFVNEGFRLNAFKHQHIVKVHGMTQENGLWGMVMEYIDGNDLSKYVQKYGQLSETDAVLYIDQIAQALEYMHQHNGTIHKDIKPHNIVLRQDRKEAVLIDFGLACEIDRITTRDGLTEGYAPLEQYGIGTVGFYTDVYALATTLYYILTVDGMNAKNEYIYPSFVRKLGAVELPPPQYYNPGISKRVNDAIIKGMELEIPDRPQTMGEFRKLLELVNQPVVNIPIQPPQVNINNAETIKIVPPTPKPKSKFQSFTENLGTIESKGIFSIFTGSRQVLVLLEMIAIPGGKFFMGSPDNDNQASDTEKPQHEVTVPSFYMGKYPITQAQWERVAALPKVKIDLKPQPSFFKGENLPVERVSWFDAQEFCARLSKATGKKYRLPSEAEWEYACRAKTTTRYYFGDSITTYLANYDRKYGQTTEVGKFPPNAFGLYDMHGNVWEWCEDNWHDNYINAPSNGSAWISQSTDKVTMRGGSWYNNPSICRSASRLTDVRAERVHLYNDFGFRVVCGVGGTL